MFGCILFVDHSQFIPHHSVTRALKSQTSTSAQHKEGMFSTAPQEPTGFSQELLPL